MSELRVPCEGFEEGLFTLAEDDARYVVRVHRLRAGDSIRIFDPVRAIQAQALIVEDRLPRVVLKVGPLESAVLANMPVTIVQALGKGDKPEQAVRDATALGAEVVQFVHGVRSVAKGAEDRSDRLVRVSAQVARQCGRGDLPRIQGPADFATTLRDLAATRAIKWVCGFRPGARDLLQHLEASNFPSEPLVVLIGPEGGFSDEELDAAQSVGFEMVTLGPYVLRMEVATAAVLATLRSFSIARS